MPKKYKNPQFSKPSSSVHPSLSSSPSVTSKNGFSTTTSSTTTVNELIQHLRRSQAPSAADRARDDTNTRTVHPSLKAILQVADTPPPRPRPGMRVTGGRRARGPAGPPPPTSWLTHSIHAPSHLRRSKTGGNGLKTELPTLERLDRLPGIHLPKESTLIHQTLKSLARNWQWHIEYDRHYLATLPMRYKEALLSYIAVYSGVGVGRLGLYTLFLDETELEDATGSETLTHLDLATSIGSFLTLKELIAYFTKQPHQASDPSSTSANYIESAISASDSAPADADNIIPDSWDTPSLFSASLISTPSPRFPALTHLSLSHSPSASWRFLLALAPHLATLTHLSLAYWPVPSLTPNSKTCSTTSPVGNVDYGASNFYSESDGDWSEAVGILRRLGRKTCCLKWLDLEGCGGWIEALGWEEPPREDGIEKIGAAGGGAVDWNGCWRAVEVVKVGQGLIPECLVEDEGGGGGEDWRRILKGSGPSSSGPIAMRPGTASEPGGAEWDGASEREKLRVKKELQAWLKTELDVSKAETAVRNIRRRGGGGGGGKPVVFQRGWSAWWIAEALKEREADHPQTR